MFNEVRERGRLDRVREGFASFFQNPGEFSDLFEGVEPAEDGSLPVDKVCDNLARVDVPNRSDYLYQALNELLFFLMFNAGQVLDEEEERQLRSRLEEIFSRLD